MIAQGPATGGGTGIAMEKGDAIGRGVVNTSAMKIGLSDGGSEMPLMSVQGHTHGSDTGATGVGHRMTSMRGDEIEPERDISALQE